MTRGSRAMATAIATPSARAMAIAIATPSALSPLPSSISSAPQYSFSVRSSIWPKNILYSPLRCSSHASFSPKSQDGPFDRDLRSVLELATDSELYELENILFGPSHFSPLLKSIASKRADIDYAMMDQDMEEREDMISCLESRFLFLAADARSTLRSVSYSYCYSIVVRGWRPTYRNVLLTVRKKLSIGCSSKLSTEDLEAEIFLHLLEEYASEQSGTFPGLWELAKTSDDQGSLGIGLSQEKVQALAAQKLGAADLQSIILKGGGVFTLTRIYQWLAKKLTGKVFLEAANYQIKKEIIKKGGQLAAINLESRAALLVAKQGFVGAASRYLGLRSMMSLLGPMVIRITYNVKGSNNAVVNSMWHLKFVNEILDVLRRAIYFVFSVVLQLWGTFLADVVIQMLGTDYARILRAIYAFAQIRITRTCRLPCDND
ncbi:hypothetical protein POTOM_049114 [Populus tomentosa]|uniref:Uncharacterized protein n=1 Tax=Populus tomentosa TaxID=118781 RepID=A0A8X8C8U1_POPTO|nr:hypothetical protein POTOM_049114 [Populus tomentosa]